MSDAKTTYVLGSRSLVGGPLIECLSQRGSRVVALTRTEISPLDNGADVRWAPLADELMSAVPNSHWVSLIPVWHLVDYLPQLADRNCRRLVALSSTSRYTKQDARNSSDRILARRLASAEDAVLSWSAERGIECAIVRPTMIYGSPSDGNVSALQAVMRRFRVMPIVRPAAGLRQPVHREDLASVVAAMSLSDVGPRRTEYTASGGEILTYREMIRRIRQRVRGPVVTLSVSHGLFLAAQRLSGGSRSANVALGMADRMNSDMVFGHQYLTSEYGFQPRGFLP